MDNQLKSPTEWLKTRDFLKYEIVESTGWENSFKRFDNDKTWEPRPFTDKITQNEFLIRMMFSDCFTKVEK